MRRAVWCCAAVAALIVEVVCIVCGLLARRGSRWLHSGVKYSCGPLPPPTAPTVPAIVPVSPSDGVRALTSTRLRSYSTSPQERDPPADRSTARPAQCHACTPRSPTPTRSASSSVTSNRSIHAAPSSTCQVVSSLVRVGRPSSCLRTAQIAALFCLRVPASTARSGPGAGRNTVPRRARAMKGEPKGEKRWDRRFKLMFHGGNQRTSALW